MLRPLLLAVAFVASASPASANWTSPPVTTEHLRVDLIARTTTVTPGQVFHGALRQRIAPGWHTYWRNPGDGGQATSLAWRLPPGWTAGDIVWRTPTRHAIGPLINFVYSGEVVLPVALRVPADARPGHPVTLRARANFIVCRDVCIPESADLSLTAEVSAAAPQLDPRTGPAIDAALAAAPRRLEAPVVFERDGATIRLAIPRFGAGGGEAFFYPYEPARIAPSTPQGTVHSAEGLVLTLPVAQGSGTWSDLAGVVVLPGGEALELAPQAAPLPAWAREAVRRGSPANAAEPDLGLISAVLFAFLGGLILNLMPCVFPILSMKAFALVRHAGEGNNARGEGIAFFLGVLLSFLALGGLLIAARAAGAEIGWGFQLQSPLVVTLLALVMLLAGLNLSGVFEFGSSLQGVGGTIGQRSGRIGAFFTGVLATVAAAPCTAPLMGPAIGWALIQPPIASIIVFLALGAGLGLPFLILSFSPRLFAWLPRPGVWMLRLKSALAFPMYGAAAWLAWVLAVQTGSAALPFLFAAALAVAFAAWTWGLAQQGGRIFLTRGLAALSIALAIPAVLASASIGAAAAGQQPAQAGALPAELWSPERVAQLRAEGRTVFVDFTAAWCITCKVNERMALHSERVAEAFRRTGAVYLRADWTRPDARIARALADQGRSGVPLYLVYGEHADPQVLPQLLTERMVIDALDRSRPNDAADGARS